jgi:predicted DNA-binding protein (UPF0251 family)
VPRPRKRRSVRGEPSISYYKPRGVPIGALQEVTLTVEELEAIRTADYEGRSQKAAASMLNVSQPTFHRVLKEAHTKIADALVNGKALRIHGGTYEVPPERWFECFQCRHQWTEPYGTGRPEACPQCQNPGLHRLAHPSK